MAGSASTSSYGIDTNWYKDGGARDHISGDGEKMSFKETGKVSRTRASAQCMLTVQVLKISDIGQSVIYTPHKNLKLNNILHVTSTSKNLLSVHRLTLDNQVFIEFHVWIFLIKDHVTKRILF